jgi:hypothetical protein
LQIVGADPRQKDFLRVEAPRHGCGMSRDLVKQGRESNLNRSNRVVESRMPDGQKVCQGSAWNDEIRGDWHSWKT